MQFNFIYVRLMYCGHQHILATHVAFFRVISLRKEYCYNWNVPESLPSVKINIISG
jgi:hypothetical protein